MSTLAKWATPPAPGGFPGLAIGARPKNAAKLITLSLSRMGRPRRNLITMLNVTKRLARTLALMALLAALPLAPAFAQDGEAAAPNGDTVVATVNGQPITEGELVFAAEDMAQDLARVPPDQRRAFLLNVMVDMKLLSSAALEAGMSETDIFAKRLKFLEERALRRAYVAEIIGTAESEEAMRAEYDAYIAAFTPADEVRASHILVEQEAKATELKAQLDGGADFATLARENSIDPGAANGGDLGFFGRGMTAPPFEEAAFALAEPGAVSEPVQSQFGWHIIKLDEKRQTAPRSYEEVTAELRQKVQIDAITARMQELLDSAEIDIADPSLASMFSNAQAEDVAPAAE